MGFGTLFIGYFFLINISYFTYTDIIAGMIMLLGLYKLSSVNKPFFYGAICAGIFALFSLFEFVVTVLGIFEVSFSKIMLNYSDTKVYFAVYPYGIYPKRNLRGRKRG